MLSRTNSDHSMLVDEIHEISCISSNGARSHNHHNSSSLTHSKYSSKSTSNLLREKETNGSHHPIINAQLVQSPNSDSSPSFYIIKVTYETGVESDGVMYKSIMLGNNERTPTVIRNAMMKLGLDDDCDRYTLSQMLSDSELLMPPSANVYYAVNLNYDLNFILRLKKDGH